MMQESLTEKLARHIMRPVDKATRQRARLHLLDWIGCVAGARQSVIAQSHIEYGADICSWLGNILEMDDIHRSSILHPGPVVWPVINQVDLPNMNALLDRAVRGYEAVIAIGATFDDRHYAKFHNTSTAGVFGAAVASLHEPDVERLVNAMGFAGSVSGGLWQMRHETNDAKQWHITRAYENGKNAAWAANKGLKAPRFILEGPQGLYTATCKDPKAMTFPDQWRIHDVSFKPWGACRHAHPAIDAALALKKKLGILEGEILVQTYADALKFCDKPDPESAIEAKFSLQHSVAIVAEKGVPELADFEDDAIARYADARARVKVTEATKITARYPEHYGARVSCADKEVECADTLGDPEQPMAEAQIIAKAHELIAWGGLPKTEADRAADLALNGDNPQDIGTMLGDWLS